MNPKIDIDNLGKKGPPSEEEQKKVFSRKLLMQGINKLRGDNTKISWEDKKEELILKAIQILEKTPDMHKRAEFLKSLGYIRLDSISLVELDSLHEKAKEISRLPNVALYLIILNLQKRELDRERQDLSLV